MAGTGTVFGRPGMNEKIRSSIMSSPSLNALPSPSSPADLVENPTLQGYYLLYDACSEILKKERDPLRRVEIEKIKASCDRWITDLQGDDAAQEATAAQPPMPPQMLAALGGPQPAPPSGAPGPAAGGPISPGAGAAVPGAA